MIASDLLLPDTGQQHDLVAIWAGNRCSKRIVATASSEQYPADPLTVEEIVAVMRRSATILTASGYAH